MAILTVNYPTDSVFVGTLLLTMFAVGGRGGAVVDPCFIMQYLVSFLVLLRKRELVALFCVLAIAWLSVISVSSSRCRGLVCDCGLSWSYSPFVLSVALHESRWVIAYSCTIGPVLLYHRCFKLGDPL